MTIDDAIRILDPKTTAEALAEVEYYGGFSGQEAVIKAVEDACMIAIAALERTRWIPCRERMPEYDGQYLAFSASTGATNIRRFSIRKDAVSGSCGEKKNVWWEYDDEWGVLQVMGITHWMPLPKPPEEGERWED